MRSPIRTAVIVAVAVVLQLALWAAFRWVGLKAHGERIGADIPLWYGIVAPPLGSVISVAPCFAVGWLESRYGIALGAFVAALASLASWAAPFVFSVPPAYVIPSALGSAILGAVYGAGGAYFAQRRGS